MNYLDNKKITLSLIEEFNPDSEFLTDDSDIQTRLVSIYNTCLMNIARLKRVEKDYTFDDKEETENDNFQEFDLPSDVYVIKDIIVQDSDTNNIRGNQADYYRVGKKLYINTKIKGTHILRYYGYPKEIPSDIEEKGEDTYKFDIDKDIQYLLPYAVASDILKIDKSVDYTAFENKYRMELQSLFSGKEEMHVHIDGGYDI